MNHQSTNTIFKTVSNSTITNSEKETLEFGKTFSDFLKPGDVVTFSGTLGSGKTTLIRGICTGLCVKEHVTSPTFTIINEYIGTIPVYHFDFYRIDNESELIELGLDEYFFGNGICLIEWPDIIENLLPVHYKVTLDWKFEPKWQNKREITVQHIK